MSSLHKQLMLNQNFISNGSRCQIIRSHTWSITDMMGFRFVQTWMIFYDSWPNGVLLRRWTRDHLVVGSIPTGTKLRNNLGQIVRNYVPLSPSSITWYQSKDGDVLRLGRWPPAWQKSNGDLPRGWLIRLPGVTACTPGSASGPTW